MLCSSTTFPKILISPCWAFKTPIRILEIVDLPEPLWPIIVTYSPLLIVNETSSIALGNSGPYLKNKWLIQ